MPQGEEGRLNSKVLLDFSQVCENEALLQGK